MLAMTSSNLRDRTQLKRCNKGSAYTESLTPFLVEEEDPLLNTHISRRFRWDLMARLTVLARPAAI
jgi:hypothetical protein